MALAPHISIPDWAFAGFGATILNAALACRFG
jgi:hypothetical protein